MLGYISILIDKAYFRARKTYYGANLNTRDHDFKNIIVVPTLNKDNDFISTSLKNSGYKIVSKTNTTLGKLFSNNQKQRPEDSSPVIYQIPCRSCQPPSSYYGEKIDFNKRKYQHQYAIRSQDHNNAIAKHMLDTNHNVHINDSRIIRRENDTHKRKIIESIIIYNRNNFNNQRTNYNLDSFTNNLLLKNCSKLHNTFSLINRNILYLTDDT